jgi:fructokinase
MSYGGIEAGGTKWVCAIGTGPGDLQALETFPTTTPDETLARAAAFFTENAGVTAVGVGSFGPIDLRSGHITTTPKPGWASTDVVGRLRGALGVPVAFDTDVNAAALGEQRWGAAKGLDTFCYLTVGTGIGGGVMAGGALVHGLTHPEVGHMRVPHDPTRDPFEGSCPFHGDCFEGLASGTAMRARWGEPAESIVDPMAWELEAEYLALGLANVTTILSPQLIVLGGGVPKQPGLIPRVRELLEDNLAGYVAPPEVVAPALGDRAGVLGAIELARLAG